MRDCFVVRIADFKGNCKVNCTAVIVRASLKSGLKQALKCFSVTILAAIIDVCVVG